MKITSVNFTELYARIFLEYYIVMLRALWDKLAVLACIAFDIKIKHKDGIDDYLDALQLLDSLTSSGKYFLDTFLTIARQRLEPDIKKDGWLRPIRDGLVHKTGLHSSGVLPQKKSLESSFALWKRLIDEHNWLREGMMSLIACLFQEGWSK